MWHLGIKKDPTLILLVGIFILLAIIVVFLIAQFQLPTRCIDPLYNPALITQQENL